MNFHASSAGKVSDSGSPLKAQREARVCVDSEHVCPHILVICLMSGVLW